MATIYGTTASDILAGSSENDVIYGYAGNDTFIGGPGLDKFYGGDNVDEFDVVDYSSSAAGVRVSLSLTYTYPVNDYHGYDEFYSIEGIIGSAFDDWIFAPYSNLGKIYGMAGNDFMAGDNQYKSYVDGGAGNDSLLGYDADTLVGGAGNDTLRSSSDQTVIAGGDGVDTYMLETPHFGNILYPGIPVQLVAQSFAIDLTQASGRVTGIENVVASVGNDTIITSAVDNHINGGGGRNLYVGSLGNDTFVANNGDELNYAHFTTGVSAQLSDNGSIVNKGVAGTDSITGRVNFIAGSGNDTIASLLTIGIASLVGGAGNDSIYAQSSLAYIAGDAGNDTIAHLISNGPSTLLGGSGDDYIKLLSTDSSNYLDTVQGGDGFDVLDYSGFLNLGAYVDDKITGIEKIIGSNQGDRFHIRTGTLFIDGGAGNDLISTLSSLDALSNDTFKGGSGNDTLIGFLGNNQLDGGADSDWVDYSFRGTGLNIDLRLSTAQNMGGGFADTLLSIENILATQQADTLIGNELANTLQGNGGNDVLSGEAGDDLLIGGTGNDSFNGGVGNDTVSFQHSGAAVNVTLGSALAQSTGGAGVDTLQAIEALIGSSFNDTLIGDALANTLIGGAGVDSLVGGNGADVYYVDAAADIIKEISTDTGVDSLYASADYSMASIHVENAYAFGGSDVDIQGNNYANQIGGGDGNNLLYGAGGHDSIYGHGANDTLIGGAGDDYLDGGVGVDTASFEVHSVAINASLLLSGAQNTGAGLDVLLNMENLTGGSANDSLRGNSASNALKGAGGNDSLLGEAGDDVLNGGTGDDVLNGGVGAGDTASFEGLSLAISANLQVAGAQNTGAGFDTLLDIENLTGGTGNDSLTGNSLNNVLNGGTGADVLSGVQGNDSYYVDHAADNVVEASAADGDADIIFSTVSYSLGGRYVETLTLTGSAAINATGNGRANVLHGNAAANILNGQAGNDTLSGGGGDDVYYFSRGHGTDIVLENETQQYASNKDTVAFATGIAVDQLWFRNAGNFDLEVSIIGTSDKIIIDNWYASQGNNIEQFQTADGQVLLGAQVQALVQAMSYLTPPPLGQTTLSPEQQSALATVIAASWN